MNYDNEIVVRAAPEVVYDIVAEPQKYAPPSVVPELVKVSSGPTRVGTRWREAVRLAPLVMLRTQTEAVAVDAPRLLTLAWKGPWMHGQLTYLLTACPEGTRFRQQETMATEGPLRLIDGWVGRSLAGRLTSRMNDIRTLAESGRAQRDGAPQSVRA